MLPESPTIGVDELLTKLEALGDHDRIAWFFAEAGVSGRRASAGACVLARWLQRETGNPRIDVGCDEVAVWRSGSTPDDRYALPEAVAEFLIRFDGLAYLGLLDEDVQWKSTAA